MLLPDGETGGICWEIPTFSRKKRGLLAPQRPEQMILTSLIQGERGHNSSTCQRTLRPHGQPGTPLSLPCEGGTGSRGGGQQAQPAPALLAKPQGLERDEIFWGESWPRRRLLEDTQDGLVQQEVQWSRL